jgi:hypothetical protein
MLRSGVTPGNSIRRFDLRPEKVTLFGVTLTNAHKSQGKQSRSKTGGGIPPSPKAMRNAQSE